MSSSSPLSTGFLSQSTIYKGVWINWSKGQVKGATLTTSTTTGAILVALLALFIQFTGSRLWRILRFTLHQIRVSKGPQDGLYYQQQVILRNFSPADAATSLMQVGWACRSKIRNSATRSLPLAVVASVFSITFLLAAILSATASTSQGNEVLISSPYCGLVDFATSNLTAVMNVLTGYTMKSMSDSVSYARSCYHSEGTGHTWQDCSTFPVPRLPSTQTNASCPFDGDICKAPAIQLDTGLMDSDLSFGVNAPPKDRIGFRRVTTCAPIEVDHFSIIKQDGSQGSGNKSTNDFPEFQYVELYYGGSQYLGTKGLVTRDYTYKHHTFLLNFTNQLDDAYIEMFQYDLSSVSFSFGSVVNGFTPLPQLMREDADVTLVLLSANSIPFSYPVDDPWYSAHSNPHVFADDLLDASGSEAEVTLYFRDRPVSVLACTEQYQSCPLSSTSDCTPLTSSTMVYEALQKLTLNAAQSATAEVLFSGYQTTLEDVIKLLGTSSLLARNSKFRSIQGFLPSDQWILEIENWNEIILADMQRLALEFATGSSDPVVLPILIPPNGSYQEHLCHNQKARSGQAQNFSVLAIALIVGLGLLILGVDLGLCRLTSYIQHGKNLKDYRRLAWKADGLLQLQRMAYEEAGFGTLDRSTKGTPVTAHGQTLAVPNVNTPGHPTLLTTSVIPSQAAQPMSTITHNGNLHVRNVTDDSAVPAEISPKSVVAVHSIELLDPKSSIDSTNNLTSDTTPRTTSTPSELSSSTRSRRHSL